MPSQTVTSQRAQPRHQASPSSDQEAPEQEAPEHGRVLDAQLERVGARIRALRHRLDMTLVQLAALTGLSHSFLSQLERGHARPSMISLERIAKALGSSQVELLAAGDSGSREPGHTGPGLLRATEGLRGSFGDGQARLLAPHSRAFEPMEYTGRNTDPGDYYQHEEDEFIYVMSGSVLADFGEKGRFVLDAGDSVYYYGGTPHRWSTLTPEGYHLFLVKQKFTPEEVPPRAEPLRARRANQPRTDGTAPLPLTSGISGAADLNGAAE
ncbi:helix-turn-helix domain-containing protein [Psychromicrobium xiongbiense]|uniref:helix-turn-helix domain-containing protein n=1 Tax=Psychromicrobium xiongbiense TaxID=3051184 RepID=UPI002552C5DA|nr:helix-turn-helix domain-containing protein [Psychromicrobium sp. YIM S02556]